MLVLYLSLAGEGKKGFITFAYNHYLKKMLSEAYRILGNIQDAEDAVHNVFLSLAKSPETLDSVSEEKRKAYLLTATRNESFRLLRRRRGSSGSIDDVAVSVSDKIMILGDGDSDLVDRIMAAISDLDPKYGDILYNYYVLEMNAKTISKRTGLSYDAVRRRISRGLEMVREKLKKEGLL